MEQLSITHSIFAITLVSLIHNTFHPPSYDRAALARSMIYDGLRKQSPATSFHAPAANSSSDPIRKSSMHSRDTTQ
jgi:hypothetical protein